MAQLDVSEFKVGDVFYGVKEINNAFHRKKIYCEIDGEYWFKYEKPLVSYATVTYRVLGILKKHLEGAWEPNSDYELATEIYVEHEVVEDEKTSISQFTMYMDDMDSKVYFSTKEDAIRHIEQMMEINKELDKT